LLDPITLCGTQFAGLRVFRHRKFESNLTLMPPPKCSHKGRKIGFGPHDFVTVAGHGGNGSGRAENWRDAMGIHWMDKADMTQAIPPAYTEYLGHQLMAVVRGIQILQQPVQQQTILEVQP
jgi:DNA (cytosine-5)-methyltransferase 1